MLVYTLVYEYSGLQLRWSTITLVYACIGLQPTYDYELSTITTTASLWLQELRYNYGAPRLSLYSCEIQLRDQLFR